MEYSERLKLISVSDKWFSFNDIKARDIFCSVLYPIIKEKKIIIKYMHDIRKKKYYG